MSAPLEITRFTEAIEAQACLLRELASELESCRSAYVSMDIDNIYKHVARQTAICERLREAARGCDAARRAVAGILPADAEMRDERMDLNSQIASAEPEPAERMRRALAEMALAKQQVWRLHRAHMVLVEGSRRTLSMLANAVMMFSPMYAAPRSGDSGADGRRA